MAYDLYNLVDFGKACYLKDARTYKLSPEQRKKYEKQYPQIAPEVRHGITAQSYESDIYSFGRILLEINNVKLKLSVLVRMADECPSSIYSYKPKSKRFVITY